MIFGKVFIKCFLLFYGLRYDADARHKQPRECTPHSERVGSRSISRPR